MKFLFEPFVPVYANDIDALIPEIWAREALMILTENMISAGLVYRDFENEIANYGDTVNAHRPADMIATRKGPNDNVTVQDVVAANIPVPLNQHIHTSFLIRDGQESMAFKDLIQLFLEPAIIGQARFIDRVVLGQYPQFLANTVGGVTANNIKTKILDLRTQMNINKVPMEGRNLIFNPVTEGEALSLDLFLAAYAVGDQGDALKNATLGRKLAFNMYMDQNMASLGVTDTAADTVASGGAVGAVTVVLTSGAVAPVAGQWLSFANGQIKQVASYNSGTKTVTLTTAFTIANVALDAVTINLSAAVNLSAGYAAGWYQPIAYNGATALLQVGQFVSFGTEAVVYTIVAADATTITLDRPLVNAITNTEIINPGPQANFNFAFHRNAIALVCRPLAQPKPGTGALSSVINYDNLSMRVVITYDGNKQGHLVTIDMLCGVAILDSRLGSLLIG